MQPIGVPEQPVTSNRKRSGDRKSKRQAYINWCDLSMSDILIPGLVCLLKEYPLSQPDKLQRKKTYIGYLRRRESKKKREIC